MGDVVNLRLARKAKAHTDAAMKAQANRAKFGRTKAEKAAAQAEADQQNRTLDGVRRED